MHKTVLTRKKAKSETFLLNKKLEFLEKTRKV